MISRFQGYSPVQFKSIFFVLYYRVSLCSSSTTPPLDKFDLIGASLNCFGVCVAVDDVLFDDCNAIHIHEYDLKMTTSWHMYTRRYLTVVHSNCNRNRLRTVPRTLRFPLICCPQTDVTKKQTNTINIVR